MATNSSEHLGLHLWEPTDQVLRTEFNQNWQKIDTAVGEVQSTADAVADAFTPDNMPYVTGTYTGDGSTTNRTITLGFKPKLVIITGTSRSSSYEAEALTRFALIGPSGASGTIADMTSTGFVVKNSGFQYPQLNVNGCAYAYVAFK